MKNKLRYILYAVFGLLLPLFVVSSLMLYISDTHSLFQFILDFILSICGVFFILENLKNESNK